MIARLKHLLRRQAPEPPVRDLRDDSGSGFDGIRIELVFPDRTCKAALHWYRTAFGAEQTACETLEDGRVSLARLAMHGTVLQLRDTMPENGYIEDPRPGGQVFLLWVKHAQDVFDEALEHGATEVEPMRDQFYGEMWGRFRDPFGYVWGIAGSPYTASEF
jgi:PhnB protein